MLSGTTSRWGAVVAGLVPGEHEAAADREVVPLVEHLPVGVHGREPHAVGVEVQPAPAVQDDVLRGVEVDQLPAHQPDPALRPDLLHGRVGGQRIDLVRGLALQPEDHRLDRPVAVPGEPERAEELGAHGVHPVEVRRSRAAPARTATRPSSGPPCASWTARCRS